MALELFTISGSPYGWRVQLALEHKRLEHTTKVLSISAGDMKAPTYLALNPHGRVPTLVDDETVVYESIAILAYLDARYPKHPIFGCTPKAVAAAWRVISEYTSYLDPAVEGFILPLYFGKSTEQADAIRAAATTITTELARYDTILAATPYLAGTELGAADFVVFPHVQSILRAASKPAAAAFELPFLPLMTKLPALDAWRVRIGGMPGYDRTYPPHWR